MLNRLLAALLLALIFATPSHAGQSPRAFLKAQTVDSREPVFMGKPRKDADAGRAAIRTGKNALAIARKYLGTNPTGWKRLWCAKYVGMIEKKLGRPGTGSNLAKSYLSYGKRVPLSQARPGDIVVTGRKGGGHVGYLVSINAKTVTLISGNSGGRGPGRRVVAQGHYPKARVLGVVRPS